MASSFSTYCFLCLFWISYQVTQNALSSEIEKLPEVGHFCSRKCENSGDQPTNETLPLYQCSCSPSCSVYGDCCFDSPHKNTAMRNSRDFICLSVVGQDRYKAVSSCPSSEISEFCKNGVGHLPPVTSRVTNITYANIFCANCNGDKEGLITWKVELRCSSGANASARYIYRSRQIWSLNEADGSKTLCKYYIHSNDPSFLEGLELRSCTANSRKRSRCSSSWEDATISEMCRSYDDPVYFRNTAFRNAHCALCNYLNPYFASCIPDKVKDILKSRVVDAKVQQYCKTRGSNTCIEALWDYTKGSSYAFADLLNINEKGCVPPLGRRCCIGEAFNYRTQRCRKIRN